MKNLTQFLQKNFNWSLDENNFSGKDASRLADFILRLSDFYIQDQKQTTPPTPWKEKWAVEAYAHYFLPLNLVRLHKVIERGQEVGFFKGLSQFVDFGCGPATAASLLTETQSWEKYFLTDVSDTPIEKLAPKFLSHFSSSWSPDSLTSQKSLGVFSYVLNELKDLPSWAFELEALMIVEPSTSIQSRRLMELRSTLLERGFHLWAPCTHEGACPLLKNSPTDWCHDSAEVDAPAWMSKIEGYLPMKKRKSEHELHSC